MNPCAARLLPPLLLSLASLPALAQGGLQAGPTLLELSSGSTSTRLTLGNTGDKPVAAQIRVYAWTQQDGEDRLLPSDRLIASPPIAEVPAGGEQLVRVVLAGPAAEGQDLAFRVVVDELPDDQSQGESGVKVRMRYLIPAFVRANGASGPDLRCRLDQGDSRLACRNAGGRPAQLGATTLSDTAGSKLLLSEGLYGYVLPGGERHWALPADRPTPAAGPLKLETQLNGQLASVVVERTP